MSVLYRALWTDETQADPRAYVAECLRRFSSWALEDSDAEALPDGVVETTSHGRSRTITIRTVESANGLYGVEASTRDLTAEDVTAWTTLLRVVTDGSTSAVLVENQMESDDLTIKVSVGRPRIVDDLLSIPGKSRLGSSNLFIEPLAIPAAGIDILTDILSDPARTLPVIVASEPGGEHADEWTTWTRRIAARVSGIATVLTLDHEAVTAFRGRLGDLAIWGGGVRVYAPVPVGDPSEGWRHRYTPGSRMRSSTDSMIDRIVYGVAQLSARRRVPDLFNVFADPASPEASTDGLMPTEEHEQLRQHWEELLDAEIAERSEVEKQLARATGHLARLKEELLAQNLGHLLWGTQHEVAADVPDEVQDVSEACLAAQSYLGDWLALPDEAMQELDGIDTAPNSFAWGNATWRSLRALAAYAKDRADGWTGGTFWDWCAEGCPLGWPATTKKLSMGESETVQNTKRLREARRFKVDPAVDPDGEILMYAHIKVAEGGGNLAPRVYFHDDTNGTTRKVHIGLVGPHYLVPNTLT